MQVAFILRHNLRTILLRDNVRQRTDRLRRLCRHAKFSAMAIGRGRAISQHLPSILFNNASGDTVTQVWNGKTQAKSQQAKYSQNDK